MIRKGTRVRVLDRAGTPTGKVLSHINWDRTYYKVQLDTGEVVTSERVERV